MTNFNSQNPLSYVGISPKKQPQTINADRDPTSSDNSYPLGTRWINKSSGALFDYTANETWNSGGNKDATTTVAGIVVINEDGTLAGADNTTVPTALATKTYADALAIAGAPDALESVKGIAELATLAEAIAVTDDSRIVTPLKAAAILAAPPAIGSATPAAASFSTLAASGLSSLSGSAIVLTGGTALNLGSDNSGDAVNLGVGTTARAIGIGNSAAAHVVTVGSLTGASQVVLNSGTAGIQLASTGAGDITINSDDTLLLDADGLLELNSSAGVIGIGNDADAQDINIGTGAAARTITVGNSSGATSVVVDCGTGALNLGTNAIAHSTSIGNVTGASALALSTGTGHFTLDGVASSNYTVGASTTTGTVTIGGAAQTGTMTLGDSSGINIVQIGSGEGATTVNIAGGATAAKVVAIATGAVANLVTIGSASGAASLDLLCGTGNFTLEGATASTYDISSTGVNTGKVTIASGTGARTLELAGGGTGAKTINIGAAASADLITIGDTTGAGSLDLVCGTGNFTLEGATASTFDISSTGVNTGTVTIASGTGARTVEIAGGGTGIKTINIGAAATADVITIGSTTAAGSTTIAAGSGKVNVTATQLALLTAASQLQVEGGAATDFIGQVTLTAGTVTVLNTNIAATDRVFVTRSDINGSTALGVLDVSITPATNFIIDARDASDASVETNDISVVDYFIVRQL